jgi:hypothetical protein
VADLQLHRIKPAYEGWNTEAAPDYVGDAQAPLVENLLCRTGKLIVRGPLKTNRPLNHTLAGTPSLGVMRGSLVYNSQAYLNLQTSLLDNYGAHVLLSTTGLSNGGLSGVAAAANLPYTRSAQIGTAAYATSETLFLKWSAAGAPTTFTEPNAPVNFVDIINHAERLFVAGGTVNGTGGAATLLFSDAGGPTAGTVADWTDDVTGLINQVVVGDAGDPIVGLGLAGRDLVILKRSSIWLMSGTGVSSFTVRRLTDTLGCVSASSVVSVDDGCYFLSDRGYWWMDGSTFVEVSDSISPTIRAAVAASIPSQYGPLLTSTEEPLQSAVYLPGGGLLLTIGKWEAVLTPPPNAPVTAEILFQGIYDIRRRTWSKYSSAVHSYTSNDVDGIIGSFRLGDSSVGFDGWSAFLLDDMMTPEAATSTTGGIDVRSAGSDTTLVPALTSAIPAKWHSRLVRLASPLSASALQRILIDSRMDVGADADAWYVTLVRGDGTTAVDEYRIPGEASGAPTYLARRRAVKEHFAEVVDVQVRMEWRDSTTPFTLAEIQDVTIAYQPTHPRAAA